MEKEEYYRKLDESIYYVYHWFQVMGDKNGVIKLVGFDRTSQAHLTLLQVASMVKKIGDVKLKINCSFRNYIKVKKEFDGLVKFSRCWADKAYPDCNTIVNTIESMFYPGILSEAYKEYYQR
jgi:hypothetical protein